MRNGYWRFAVVVVTLALALPADALVSQDTTERFSDILMKAPAENHWQVKADDVYGWLQANKIDLPLLMSVPIYLVSGGSPHKSKLDAFIGGAACPASLLGLSRAPAVGLCT